MRPSLRPVAILLGALAVLIAVAVAAALPATDEGNPSSSSPGKLGTLALYTWMDRLGLQVHRISGAFDVSNTDMLVSYDPLSPFSSSDVDAIMAHLRGGGDMILAVDNIGSIDVAQPLLNRINVQVAAATPAGTATLAQPFDSSDRVHAVNFGAGFAFLDAQPSVALLGENGLTVAAAVQIKGGGRAYLIGSTLPLSNDGLRHDDSQWLVLSTLERARGGRIAFDEFHHGEVGPARTGAAAVFNGPVGIAAALAAVVALSFLAISGRRLGRPVTDADTVTVPSATGYVEAVAQLFSRSRRLGAVAARYADELKRHVGARTGIDAHLVDASFVAALHASGSDRTDAVQALLQRARSLAESQPDESALLRLARDVDEYERAWSA
jgi:uncharacterized protein DUF4350